MDSALRTIIYIDGFNLYYSALTKSAYKWLDLQMLFEHKIIKPIEPASKITKIKYFTSPILGRFASDQKSPNRQTKYHNALKAHHADLLEIITGYHTPKITNAYHAYPTNGSGLIKVQVMEEKQTDVNISVHMYRDAAQSHADQLVLVSNDSDLAPAIEMIRNDYANLKIGIILPALSQRHSARKSGKLKRLADWTREHLREDELQQSQLPTKIQNHKNKTIQKPEEW